ELGSDEVRRGAPELRNARRGAVVGLIVANRLDAALTGGRGAVERAVADLELDHVLAGGFQRARHREHGEGGLDGERARELAELYGHGDTLEKPRVAVRGSSPRALGWRRAGCEPARARA